MNDEVYFTSTLTVPTGITTSQVYYIQAVPTADTFKVSTTPSGTVLDFTTSEPLPGAQLHFYQNQLTKDMSTDQGGQAQIFENGFSGTWQLLVTHSDYRCVIVNDVEIWGGQSVIIKLKHI